jgi:predicted lipoprotein with Yx(FWY)xxD motif
MTGRLRLLLTAAALAGVLSPAMADMGMVKDGILVNEKGMTLYTFDKDADGVSACYDKCATNWPPLLAAADAKAEGDWSLGDRKDGAKQWAYKGKPLYLWIKDEKPGDTTGDGVNDVWHTAKQ